LNLITSVKYIAPSEFEDVYEQARRLSENEIFFPRSRKAKIITTGIH